MDELKLSLSNVMYFDCLVLTEKWQIIDTNLYQNQDITWYNESNLNQNDGVFAYVNCRYFFTHRIPLIGPIRILEFAINISETKKIMILEYYRSPSKDSYNHNIIEFITNMQMFLKDTEVNCGSCCVFVGGMNIDLLDLNNDTIEYINNLSEYGFISAINNPTRLKDCLYHMFVRSIYNIIDNIIRLIIESNITDHFTITLQIIFDNKEA